MRNIMNKSSLIMKFFHSPPSIARKKFTLNFKREAETSPMFSWAQMKFFISMAVKVPYGKKFVESLKRKFVEVRKNKIPNYVEERDY